MSDPAEFFVYDVATEDGDQRFLSVIRPELATEFGLISEGIIGAVVGDDLQDAPLDPAQVQENPQFVAFLGQVLAGSVDSVERLRKAAEQEGEGHLYIVDGRSPDPADAVPPEDVLGVVGITDGKLIAGSYQHNPQHRLFSEHGLFQLPDELHSAFYTALQTRVTSSGN
ncbi:hypothetical protein D5S17_27635 [Pseudonocardiaceae bacterium YIM PH 21723]|nr:hypothetical protein D5S17_27635 [Pseudonocardiaceae bacterium YIM PH 21723]